MKRKPDPSRNHRLHAAILVGILLFVSIAFLPWLEQAMHPIRYIRSPQAQLTYVEPLLLDGELDEKEHFLTRGEQVVLEKKGKDTSVIRCNGETITIPNTYLATSIEDCILPETVYPRRLLNLREQKGGALSDIVVEKGESLSVLSVDASDFNLQTGEIDWIQVEYNGSPYYVSGTAVEFQQEDALAGYGSNLTLNAVLDPVLGQGASEDAWIDQTDLKGYTQPNWSDNPRPQNLAGIHITLDNVLNHTSELLEYGRTTGLNALVISMKGPDGTVWFDSDTVDTFYQNPRKQQSLALASKSQIQSVFQQLKDAGFYLVGRIETFADSALALDDPTFALTDASSQPVALSGSYWLSPYQRRNWEYNVDLAKEIADLGVQEVQFDFCRFPDGLDYEETDDEVDFKNEYDESKTAAIQNFIYYAREELEPLHVYTGVDLFAGPVMENYDYNIGQYFPAMAAAANIVSPMAYPDTLIQLEAFENLDETSQSDQILETFSEEAVSWTEKIPNPAEIHLWVQGVQLPSTQMLTDEINGTRQGGLSNILIWTDEGNMDLLTSLSPAF